MVYNFLYMLLDLICWYLRFFHWCSLGLYLFKYSFGGFLNHVSILPIKNEVFSFVKALAIWEITCIPLLKIGFEYLLRAFVSKEVVMFGHMDLGFSFWDFWLLAILSPLKSTWSFLPEQKPQQPKGTLMDALLVALDTQEDNEMN